MKKNVARLKGKFSKRHGLSLMVVGIVTSLIILYHFSDEQKHWGSFFGNAIADWSGVLLTVLATKHLYEKHSAESKKEPGPKNANKAWEFLRAHSLSIFLLITGAGWVVLFAHSNPQGKWGQVVGNIVSEWTQVLGLVLMTKKLIEAGSEESNKKDG
jgi:purine-cytosine permease-like protein